MNAGLNLEIRCRRWRSTLRLVKIYGGWFGLRYQKESVEEDTIRW